MGKLLQVVVRRCVNAGITIFGIISLNYVLIRLMPGSPALSFCPRGQQYVSFCEFNTQFFGLNQSPLQQFEIYLQKLFTLDWGVSFQYYNQPVADILLTDLSWTLLLVGTSTVLTIVFGMSIGAYAAVRRGKPFDYFSTGFGIFFYGMPIFWLGLVLQAAFVKNSLMGQYFTWWPTLPLGHHFDPNLPAAWSWDWAHISSTLVYLTLPALTLSLGTLAGISLIMRSSLIDVMTEDFVTTAKAKGLSDRQVLSRHIFPNGLPPMISLIALDLAFVLGGAYQVEIVFNYRGIGWETIQAIYNLDYPMLQFIIVIGGVAIVLANLASDFILLLLDPRIKIT